MDSGPIYSERADDTSLSFSRDYDFPPVIVWDALVDADLVSGWLAEADITPEVGGEYNLRWMHRLTQPASLGRITVLQPLVRLDVDTTNVGRLQFELEGVPGGTRGLGTRLRVAIFVEIEPAFAARVKADWLTNLDQLEDLLRGHPVDWGTWDRDRQETWTQHYDEVENSTA